SRQFVDVERAVLVGDAIWAIEARDQDLDLAFAVLIRGDGINLVLEPRADKDRALLTERQRASIGHAAGIEFEVEALRRLQLVDWNLVGSGGERRRRHRCELRGGRVILRPADQRRAGRQRRRRGLSRGRRSGRSWTRRAWRRRGLLRRGRCR